MTDLDTIQPDNRRAGARLALNVPLQCNGRPATSINISRSGIRFVSDVPLNTGARANLQLEFNGVQVNLKSEAVWSQRVGPGSVVGATFLAGSNVRELERFLGALA